MTTKPAEGLLTLNEMAMRFSRLTVEVKRHSAEMADVRKERRELGAKLLPLLGEAGYVGERQLYLEGFDGYESFGLSAVQFDKPIMQDSGDTETLERLQWRSKKTRRPRGG